MPLSLFLAESADSQILPSFLIGLVSACSLPLGALTARFYKPGDRVTAFLMSFGGGALLAALTIDLAGPALDKGHFYPLAAGCITGGLLFVILNQVVNTHGGFLRKASTTIFYLRGQRNQRRKRFIERMARIDVFQFLSPHDLRELADAAVSQKFDSGMTLFRKRDPARYLYIVEQGSIALFDGAMDSGSKSLTRSDGFGYMALLTGSPHAASAIADEDSEILMVPREAIEHVLRSNVELQGAVTNFLLGDRVTKYLRDVQQLSDPIAQQQVRSAVSAVEQHGELPPPAEFLGGKDFSELVDQIRRVDFFSNLPNNEVHEIASCVYMKKHEKGHTFFHRGELADRMYIIQSGEVVLLDAKDTHRSAIRLKSQEAFGAMSFVTGTRHAVTAVAAADTSVWVLLRVDFDQLVSRCPTLARAVQRFLQRADVEAYLHDRHQFDSDRANAWVRRAIRSMDLGKLIPNAGSLSSGIGPQHGAPLAIWLGILLDGIPESLVIGAGMLHNGVSLSLIAGLFLSNYPEALSSSVGMRQQGIKFSRILWMWTSLMVFTGIGAALGNLFFRGAPHVLFSFVEGVAAGAMLTMIAETMLPEAYFKGGGIVGFSTLLGFLAAIFFKSIG